MDQLLLERDVVLSEQKNQLRNLIKQWAYKKITEVIFDVGDMVYVKAQRYRFKSLANRPNEKLGPRFMGHLLLLRR